MSRPRAGSNHKSSLKLAKINLFQKPQNTKVWVEISKKNLLHNVREISKNLSSETRLMAVLKSNAYGHGIFEIAKILLNLQPTRLARATAKRATYNLQPKLWFGVDSLTEALELQKIQGANKVPILILGYVPLNSLNDVPENVRLTLYNSETIKTLGKLNRRFKIHIKIETGTNRQGIEIEDLPNFINQIKKYKNIEIEGISSHFAEAENISSNFTQKQLKIFNNASILAEKLLNKKLIKHIACSAAASHIPQSHFNMVRLGINLYGLQSIDQRAQEHRSTGAQLLNLKPVLSLNTIVAQVKNVREGESVGYGLSEMMPYNGQIAILPIGYWDGYDRKLSGVGEVLIHGERCKLIGRICMNMCMVLLPKNINVKPEDGVVLIGKQGAEEITTDELAAKIKTINYEVVTRINPLITRIVVEN